MSAPGGADAAPAAPRRLFESHSYGGCCISQYAVSADGQRFLFIERKAPIITILMNWLDRRGTN
jgi:hypothetical protein